VTADVARRAAVLGHPISHSLSPRLHRAAYQALGLDWTYEAVDVDEAAFPGWLAGLDGQWAGLSLTMPLKRVVLPLLDRVEPLAVAVGAANTVLFTLDGTLGANTDVYGLVQAIREAAARAGVPGEGFGRAVILGGGATAASALAAVAELGTSQADVYVRAAARCGPLLAAADRLGVKPALRPWSQGREWMGDLVICTLPAHQADPLAEAVRYQRRVWGPVPRDAVLLDVAYDPWPSALAGAWADAGGTVAPGLSMLLHQAVEQVRLMTGRPAPVEAMRAAVELPPCVG
jgi:shikimate dehydrogenase